MGGEEESEARGGLAAAAAAAARRWGRGQLPLRGERQQALRGRHEEHECIPNDRTGQLAHAHSVRNMSFEIHPAILRLICLILGRVLGAGFGDLSRVLKPRHFKYLVNI